MGGHFCFLPLPREWYAWSPGPGGSSVPTSPGAGGGVRQVLPDERRKWAGDGEVIPLITDHVTCSRRIEARAPPLPVFERRRGGFGA